MMKLKTGLAAIALVLLGATTAHAQLTVTLANPVQNFAPDPMSDCYQVFGADAVCFNGLLESLAADVDIIGYSAGILPLNTTDEEPPFALGPLPDTLGPTGNLGTSFNADPLFVIHIPDPNNTPSFDGTFTIFYVDALGATQQTSANFRINIPAGNVPEPGSVALLVGSMVGGSALLMRRRRK